MKFNVFWSDSGELNFDSNGVVIERPDVDIIANSNSSISFSESSISIITDTVLDSAYLAPETDHEFSVNINVNRDPKYSGYQKYQSATAIKKENLSLSVKTIDLDISKTHTQSNAKQQQKTILNTRYKLSQQQPTIPIYHHEADKLSRTINHFRRYIEKAFIGSKSRYENALLLSNGTISRYKLPPKMSNGSATGWQDAELLISQMIGCDFNDAVSHRHDTFNGFQDGINATGKRPLIVVPPIEPELPIDANLIFKALWDGTGELDFLRIELDALIVMNEVTIYHVANDGTKTAVHPVSASLDFDIDSFVWSFSGQFFGASNLVWLTNRANFEINVNGHQLLFTLREFTKANSFASDAYNFTCVTNSQWLGQPYATLHNGTIDSAISAWQLVADKFSTENFTLSRTQTPDWLLAQDSYSYVNKSAIEIALQIATASGAILQPDKIADIIHVSPRYKISPWSWASLTDAECDHVINADYIDTQSSKDNSTPQLNSVLISGETHGLITNVVKSGTAGDLPGTDVLSNLSQDHNVNAELARNIIADSGEQEVLGITVPLLQPDSAFDLVLPGDIVRIVYPDSKITGVCLSNSASLISTTDITQSISLELNNGYN